MQGVDNTLVNRLYIAVRKLGRLEVVVGQAGIVRPSWDIKEGDTQPAVLERSRRASCLEVVLSSLGFAG